MKRSGRDNLRSQINLGLFITAIGSLLTTVIVILFGTGLLMHPDVIIQYEIAELNYPQELKREMDNIRMKYISKELGETLIKAMEGKLPELAEKYSGFLVREGVTWEDLLKKDEELGKMPESKRKAILDVRSEIIFQALTNMPYSLRKYFTIPDKVMHYRVINKGRKTAHKIVINVTPSGTLYSVGEIYSQDEISEKYQKEDNFIIKLERLAPGHLLSGSIWYEEEEEKRGTNPISVSFDEGSGKLEEYKVIRQIFPWYFWILLLVLIGTNGLAVILNVVRITKDR